MFPKWNLVAWRSNKLADITVINDGDECYAMLACLECYYHVNMARLAMSHIVNTAVTCYYVLGNRQNKCV